jgi:hypothetical protein
MAILSIQQMAGNAQLDPRMWRGFVQMPAVESAVEQQSPLSPIAGDGWGEGAGRCGSSACLPESLETCRAADGT